MIDAIDHCKPTALSNSELASLNITPAPHLDANYLLRF
jgi:hypothetical protein